MNSTEKLYTCTGDENIPPLLLKDYSRWDEIAKSINRFSLAASWCVPELHTELPLEQDACDIQSLYVPGALVFSPHARNSAALEGARYIEWLTVSVNGEMRFLLNCLSCVEHLIEAKSKVLRSLTGDIFYVSELAVADSETEGSPVFSLKHSNRMQLFLRQRLVDRLRSGGLRGITFSEIGHIVSG